MRQGGCRGVVSLLARAEGAGQVPFPSGPVLHLDRGATSETVVGRGLPTCGCSGPCLTLGKAPTRWVGLRRGKPGAQRVGAGEWEGWGLPGRGSGQDRLRPGADLRGAVRGPSSLGGASFSEKGGGRHLTQAVLTPQQAAADCPAPPRARQVEGPQSLLPTMWAGPRPRAQPLTSPQCRAGICTPAPAALKQGHTKPGRHPACLVPLASSWRGLPDRLQPPHQTRVRCQVWHPVLASLPTLPRWKQSGLAPQEGDRSALRKSLPDAWGNGHLDPLSPWRVLGWSAGQGRAGLSATDPHSSPPDLGHLTWRVPSLSLPKPPGLLPSEPHKDRGIPAGNPA